MLRTGDRAWEVTHAERLGEALRALAGGGIEAVLLVLMLPDAGGLEVVDRIVGAFPDVPIVVMTSCDATLAAEALQRGAQDYLVKSEANPSLLARSLTYA